MAGNPFFQNLDPYAVPDAVTPSDTPSSPAGYAAVTPPGTGPAPAPYDIAAPQNIAGITAAVTAAMDLSGGMEGTGIDAGLQAQMAIPGYSPGTGAVGAGIPDRNSPRQAEALNVLNGPQGAGGVSVLAGFPDYETANVSPGADLQTPIQGQMGTYPVSNTYQPGLRQFMAGAGASAGGGLPGVPPESASMGPSAGGDYPGTTQGGLTKYGGA